MTQHDADDFQPTIEDTLALVGRLLILTQSTEDRISDALRIAFKEGSLSAQDLVRKDRKTLGQLVGELRDKLEVQAEFDGLLLAFVEQRNLFVHRLHHQDWFNLDSEDGINAAWQALGKYMSNLEQVSLAFTGYVVRSLERGGFPKNSWWDQMEQSGYLPHIREFYYPKLDRALKHKVKRPK